MTRTPLLLAALVVLIGFLPSTLHAQSASCQDQYDQAETFYFEARFEQAVGLLIPCSESEPDQTLRAEVLWLLARTYNADNQPERTVSTLKKMIPIRPNFSPDPDIVEPTLIARWEQARSELEAATQPEPVTSSETDPGMETPDSNSIPSGIAETTIEAVQPFIQNAVIEREDNTFVVTYDLVGVDSDLVVSLMYGFGPAASNREPDVIYGDFGQGQQPGIKKLIRFSIPEEELTENVGLSLNVRVLAKQKRKRSRGLLVAGLSTGAAAGLAAVCFIAGPCKGNGSTDPLPPGRPGGGIIIR